MMLSFPDILLLHSMFLVDGGFTQWSLFSSCSQSCGMGSQERKRTCTNPLPQHNGQNCVGDTVEERQCKIKECPSMCFCLYSLYAILNTVCNNFSSYKVI